MKKSANSREPGASSEFAAALTEAGLQSADRWAVAVSGGGDSVALMHLAAAWADTQGASRPVVLTVDHGLRAGSHRDAAAVAVWARHLGLEPVILRWTGAKPKTGIEEQARIARYRLLGQWCAANDARWLLAGHTRDDLAENFLLRLGRGSGVDGLSAMRTTAPLPLAGFRQVMLLRPLLGCRRRELREFLLCRGAEWLEDPMNDDIAFTRSRMRKLLPLLEDAGIGVDRIVAASQHLGRARSALEQQTSEFLARHSALNNGGALLDGAALARMPPEIGLRVLSAALQTIGQTEYRPRFERLHRLYNDVTAPEFRGATLAGCRVRRAPRAAAAFGAATIAITPEPPRRPKPGAEK